MEKIRPKLPSSISEGDLKEEELFQNMVLRPVIKMQHQILILRVKDYFLSKKVLFNSLDQLNKEKSIRNAFQKDVMLKKEIQGFVLGQLNEKEFKEYLKNKKSINKRIFQMVQNRMMDSIIELS
tara:strand:+ start:136 stop:507 length:372 start_codon:yes stop_codon:yes gene_type:complete